MLSTSTNNKTCHSNMALVGDLSSREPYGFEEYNHNEGDDVSAENIIKNSSSSSPSSGNNSDGYAFQADHHDVIAHNNHSLINFKSSSGYDHFMHNGNACISFDQLKSTTHKDDDYSMWESNQWHINNNNNNNPRLTEDSNCFDTASNYGFFINSEKGSNNNHGGDHWLYSEATAVTDTLLESAGSQDGTRLKRPHMGESMQCVKKQCTSTSGSTKKPTKSITPSKDPQSIAAKNRRERISERLKILQELVPNGSKVDLVTMLEKAISYVKFLQLQVKVLATDEFWPVQGGKAPDISQVKEAIDAILSSSQRDKNSIISSK